MRPWDVEKSQSWYYVCSLLVTGGKKFSQSLAITPLDESEQSPRDFREVRCTHAWFDERVYYFEHKIAVRIVNFREFTQTYNTNLGTQLQWRSQNFQKFLHNVFLKIIK